MSHRLGEKKIKRGKKIWHNLDCLELLLRCGEYLLKGRLSSHMDIYEIVENNQNGFCRGKTYLTNKMECNAAASKWIAKFCLISTGGFKNLIKPNTKHASENYNRRKSLAMNGSWFKMGKRRIREVQAVGKHCQVEPELFHIFINNVEKKINSNTITVEN